MEDSFVLSVSMDDVIDGSVKMPFTSCAARHATQLECPDLRRIHAHLTQLRDSPFKEDYQSRSRQESQPLLLVISLYP